MLSRRDAIQLCMLGVLPLTPFMDLDTLNQVPEKEEDTRLILKRTAEGKVKVRLRELRAGDVFEMYEPDGKPVAGGVFQAGGDAFVHEKGEWRGRWAVQAEPFDASASTRKYRPFDPMGLGTS